jgi:hypothetical protein
MSRVWRPPRASFCFATAGANVTSRVSSVRRRFAQLRVRRLAQALAALQPQLHVHPASLPRLLVCPREIPPHLDVAGPKWASLALSHARPRIAQRL